MYVASLFLAPGWARDKRVGQQQTTLLQECDLPMQLMHHNKVLHMDRDTLKYWIFPPLPFFGVGCLVRSVSKECGSVIRFLRKYSPYNNAATFMFCNTTT